MYQHARWARFADGADEVHQMRIAQRTIAAYTRPRHAPAGHRRPARSDHPDLGERAAPPPQPPHGEQSDSAPVGSLSSFCRSVLGTVGARDPYPVNVGWTATGVATTTTGVTAGASGVTTAATLRIDSPAALTAVTWYETGMPAAEAGLHEGRGAGRGPDQRAVARRRGRRSAPGGRHRSACATTGRPSRRRRRPRGPSAPTGRTPPRRGTARCPCPRPAARTCRRCGRRRR